MTFREKVKKAFRRNSDKDKNNGKPKIEYYRRGECPRSKYRGPVDPEHRRKLYNWNFETATADRPRSFELDLSPCTSLPDRPPHEDESDATTLGDVSESEPEVVRAQHIQIIGMFPKVWEYGMGNILTRVQAQVLLPSRITKWLSQDHLIPTQTNPRPSCRVVIRPH